MFIVWTKNEEKMVHKAVPWTIHVHFSDDEIDINVSFNYLYLKGWKKVQYLLNKLINEQGEIFRLFHEKLQTEWKENPKNRSEHALLSGTSD